MNRKFRQKKIEAPVESDTIEIADKSSEVISYTEDDEKEVERLC